MRILKDTVLLHNFTDKRGRIYNRADLEMQLQNKTFYGELDTSQALAVDLTRVSHLIENIVVTDTDVIGDIQLLETPMGMIAESLLDNNVELHTSIRATGIVEADLHVTDLKLITFDLMKA